MIPLLDTLLPGTTGALVTIGPEALALAALFGAALVRVGIEVHEELRRQATRQWDARSTIDVAPAASRLAA